MMTRYGSHNEYEGAPREWNEKGSEGSEHKYKQRMSRVCVSF